MRVVVIVNCGAGSVVGDDIDTQQRQIVEAFADAGAQAEVTSVPGDGLEDALRAAAADGPDAVVVAGGDGTLGTAAAALAGGEVPLGILPLGTFNHFAKDLGMPLDLAEAAAAVVGGERRKVDLAEVNDRCFVNNSSIGVYPLMVALRDEIREERGWGKVRAAPVAAYHVFRRMPLRRLTITCGDYKLRLRTPFVFVGNNRYDVGPSGIGERSCLTDGELCLYVARSASRARLLWMAVKSVVRGAAHVTHIDSETGTEIEIDAHGHRVEVAIDGEVVVMRSPLRYRVRPAALTVLAPPAEPPGTTRGAPADVAGIDADPGR